MSDPFFDSSYDYRVVTARQIALRESAIHDAIALMATDALPQIIWAALPSGYIDYYNLSWYTFTGAALGTTDGETWLRLIHPDDRENCWAVWQHSLATGEALEISYRLRRHDAEYRWMLCNAKPVYGNAEAIVRWVGTCLDVHESKLCTEQNVLLAKEMDHRIANLFAVVGSLLALEALHSSSAEQLASSMQNRLASLNAAHQLVRGSIVPGNAQAVTVHSIIHAITQPYNKSQNQCVTLLGPDHGVADGALTAVALLFHELCTNAAKYGALKHDLGAITITTEITGPVFKLHWVEGGGSVLTEIPKEGGFGTALIRAMVEQQLRGTIERELTTDGMRVQLTLPINVLQHVADKVEDTH